MSTSRRIAFGAFAQWVSRGVTIVLGLVLMPILLKNLPKEEVGIWLLLGQSWAVLGILDLGFGAIFTRRIALAKGKSGGSPDAVLNAASLAEIRDLVACGKRIYRFMAAGVFTVAWSLGFFYLRNLELQTLSHPVVWTAWTILCACQALTVWSSVWTCLLQGMGNVGWDGLLATLISGLTMMAQIAAVFFWGGGVIALASIATAGAIGQLLLVHRFTKGRSPEVFQEKGKWNPAVLKGVPGLALRAWLSTLGSVFVYNTDGFFIASAEGAENVPAFRAAFLVVLNVHILASVFAQSSSVFMSQLWQANEKEEARRIFQRNLRIGLCFMICGGTAILFAGESLFNAWLGPANYVGPKIVGIFVLLFLLEQQTLIISTSCRATDYEPFAIWMILGGLLKLGLAAPMIEWMGLLGLALASLLAQLASTHLIVIRRGLGRLEFPVRLYFRRVLWPCLAVLLTCFLACYIAKSCTFNTPDWVTLVAVLLAAGAVFCLAFWMLVLTQDQRRNFLSTVGVLRFT